MNIAVIINPKAGRVNVDLVKRKINHALFRCSLDFFIQPNKIKLLEFIKDQITMEVDCFVIVGGDGTINLIANMAMHVKNEGFTLPPLCIVSMGTANDLAYEIGIDERIEKAVLSVFSGNIEQIDLLEVQSGDVKKYMFTNGGLGLTAITAKAVNDFRDSIRALENLGSLVKPISLFGQNLIRWTGSNIYNLMLIKKWIQWKNPPQIDIETSCGFKLQTQSPFILVNNQKTIARKFYTAPATNNKDGRFNLLVFNMKKGLRQIIDVARLGQGRWAKSNKIISKEVQAVTFTDLSQKDSLSFIGDGELLFEKVSEIKVKCIHPGLKVIVQTKGEFV